MRLIYIVMSVTVRGECLLFAEICYILMEANIQCLIFGRFQNLVLFHACLAMENADD